MCFGENHRQVPPWAVSRWREAVAGSRTRLRACPGAVSLCLWQGEDAVRRIRFCVVPVLATLLALPLGAVAAEADKAAEAFDAVYGADLKRIKATPDPRDDLDLATRLFAAAKEATGQPEFLTVLCGKAHELASAHPNGYPTAIAAMELLGASVPGKRVWCAERVAEVRQWQFDVEFTRTGGYDNIVFLIPVAASEAGISLNAFTDTAAFEATHGQGEPKENRVKIGKLQNDRKYSAHVQVLVRGDDAQVTVSLDGKRVLGWTGPHAALTMSPDWSLPRRQGLGMGTWCSNVVFHTAKLKMLSGKAKLLGPKR